MRFRVTSEEYQRSVTDHVRALMAMVDAGERTARAARDLGRAAKAYGRTYVAATAAGWRSLLFGERPNS